MDDQPAFSLPIFDAVDPRADAEDNNVLSPNESVTSAQEAYDSVLGTIGGEAVLDHYEGFKRVGDWRDVAYFSPCDISGTAKEIPDQYGATSSDDCRYWFDAWSSQVGFTWVSCSFRAPFGPAPYVMTAKFDSPGQAGVDCQIAGNYYPLLPVSGPTTQAFTAELQTGWHTFVCYIDQQSGPYQFLSLTVHGVLPAGTRIVPYVRNEPTKSAADRVRKAGLKPAFTGDVNTGNSYVFNQSPVGGRVVPAGSTVTLQLRGGPTP